MQLLHQSLRTIKFFTKPIQNTKLYHQTDITKRLYQGQIRRQYTNNHKNILSNTKHMSSTSNTLPTKNVNKSTIQSKKIQLKDPIVWIDLEMTGLDVEKDTIIEIAVIITDGTLEKEIEGPEIAIKHEDKVFDEMSEWCIDQHGKSGLTQRCKNSTISLYHAERMVLDFLKVHLTKNTAQLAGSSVHFDKSFLAKHMPEINKFLHYRIIDVSSFKEICRRWYHDDYVKMPKKVSKHTALSDIKESISELKYYRRSIFK